MPKAWPVPKLTVRTRLTRAAALILEVKLPEVLSYQDAAVAGTVDGIHDMRVAAKRLREAVRVLRPALPSHARKRLLAEVEQINDMLGLVRDCDVQAEAFQKIRHREPRAKALGDLCRRLNRERRRCHRKLCRFLEELEQEGFAEFYQSVMAEMLAAAPRCRESVAHFAVTAVGERLEAVVAGWNDAHKPKKLEAFHHQRIQVKKLKYALEPFLTLLPAAIEPLYDQIAEVQELMGLVHDCDVQSEVLAAWARKQGETATSEVVERLLQRDRRKALRQLTPLLKQMEEEDWAAALRGMLGEIG